jgi:hypothetical protein
MACSSVCMLYGLRRDDSAAEIHCLAYSAVEISVGIEALGRILYVWRYGPETGALVLDSFGPASNTFGEFDMLDMDERAEEASSRSVFIEEAIESRALSGLRWILPPNTDFE